jgi:putative transposase
LQTGVILYYIVMPSRNRLKIYVPEGYYHIYNRGVEKRLIFQDDADYQVFLNLLKRYLDGAPHKDASGRQYEWLHDRLELLAYCLLPNHYHLLIYVHDELAMTRLLRGAITSYTGYFNKKYQRVGPLFQDRYKASHILNDAYLQHISRYIHLNPKDWQQWEYSSLPYYLGHKKAGWLQPQRMLEVFQGDDYLEFVRDYRDHKQMLEEIKLELADY